MKYEIHENMGGGWHTGKTPPATIVFEVYELDTNGKRVQKLRDFKDRDEDEEYLKALKLKESVR